MKWPTEDIMIPPAGRIYLVMLVCIITSCNVSYAPENNIINIILGYETRSKIGVREIRKFLLNLIRHLEIFLSSLLEILDLEVFRGTWI